MAYPSSLPKFKPWSWIKNGHLDTLYAKLRQEPAPEYRRELLLDSHQKTLVAYDFVDSDNPDAPLVVLFHGLEGSSLSHYSIAMMNAVKRKGWNGVVAHFRGCGGVANTAEVAYHSGDSAEVAYVLQLLKKRYKKVYAIGFSLGGNVLSKYLGEARENAVSEANVVVSAPLDLVNASEKLSKGLSKRIYIPYFLRSLIPKIKSEAQYHDSERIAKVAKAKTLREFDYYFTAPLHGYESPEDYYRRASAKPYLKYIEKPTMIINAKNDPFMYPESLPKREDVSKSVYLMQPERGGHVGFVSGTGKGHINWLPEMVLQFFERH